MLIPVGNIHSLVLNCRTVSIGLVGGKVNFVLDSLFQGVILGTLDGEEHSDFVAVPYGKGYCYLNLNPRAFTNFHVLDSAGENYFYKALSYLPDREDRLCGMPTRH